MRMFCLFVLLFQFSSCGNYNNKLVANSSSGSVSALTESNKVGRYVIPPTQSVGGSRRIEESNSASVNVDTQGTSSHIVSYLNSLSASPYNSTQYCVKYSGSYKNGQCPFNPTAFCKLITLQSITVVANSFCP